MIVAFAGQGASERGWWAVKTGHEHSTFQPLTRPRSSYGTRLRPQGERRGICRRISSVNTSPTASGNGPYTFLRNEPIDFGVYFLCVIRLAIRYLWPDLARAVLPWLLFWKTKRPRRSVALQGMFDDLKVCPFPGEKRSETGQPGGLSLPKRVVTTEPLWILALLPLRDGRI